MPFNFTPEVAAEALSFFRQKGWQVGFDYRDVWREEHQVAWTVAKATELDVLAAIRHEVDRAIESGQTLADFRSRLTPTLQRLGWWGIDKAVDPVTGALEEVQLGSPRRLNTIYRTNLRTARAAGQTKRIERTQETHPYLLYRIGPSRVHRRLHVSWNGLLLPATHPWWSTHFPPNGWGCKCRVRQVNKREGDRLGVSTAPAVRRVRWVNKRTGKVERVPEGIDPGWDFHPGTRRLPHQQAILAEKRREAARILERAINVPELPRELFDA